MPALKRLRRTGKPLYNLWPVCSVMVPATTHTCAGLQCWCLTTSLAEYHGGCAAAQNAHQGVCLSSNPLEQDITAKVMAELQLHYTAIPDAVINFRLGMLQSEALCMPGEYLFLHTSFSLTLFRQVMLYMFHVLF